MINKSSFDIKQALMSISSAFGVSGYENSVHERVIFHLEKYAKEIKIDKMQNLIAYVNEQKADRKTILIDAHLDQIGFVITYIDDNGFIKLGELGRSDTRLFPAQSVTIYGKEQLKGVIASLPPHVKNDSKKTPKLDEIYIDTGLSKAELEKKVKLGDAVLIDSTPVEMLNDRFYGRAFDNRCGVVSVLYALSLLCKKQLNCNLVVQFSSQEEVGTRGAMTGTFKINPDEAIVVDVSFGKTPELSLEHTAELGSGVMIGFSSVLSKRLSKDFVKLAADENIPYTIEVMASSTGTNADPISQTNAGVEAVTLSIPLRYMHTPVEVIDISDVKNTGELIAKYIGRYV